MYYTSIVSSIYESLLPAQEPIDIGAVPLDEVEHTRLKGSAHASSSEAIMDPPSATGHTEDGILVSPRQCISAMCTGAERYCLVAS